MQSAENNKESGLSPAEKAILDSVREGIIGLDYPVKTPFGKQLIRYFDWAASGRLYRPIEDKLIRDIGPFVANTHTETSATGEAMTHAYHEARDIIREHVHASTDDILLTIGSGMTRVVNKFQRILGLKVPDKLRNYIRLPDEMKPIVFVTHMEHHSNHTSWLETIADVVCIEPGQQGLVSLKHLDELLDQYGSRSIKIAAVSAGSNVTGIQPPYREIARKMHKNNGLCFVDFAYAAPYVDMDMHPENDPEGQLDAIYFSPHKFLGGPGSAGVLLFNKNLYNNQSPDNPGGGTVKWTNPWGSYSFVDDIEVREDGGTPAFLQTIKAAMAIRLKEEMGTGLILKKEAILKEKLFNGLSAIKGVNILAGHIRERLGVMSFYIDGLHYNLGVRLLNDRYGIQTRGGCSCAGTYGHYLLHVSPDVSDHITSKIEAGDLSEKPGWIRASLHPVITTEEMNLFLNAVEDIVKNHRTYAADYNYIPGTNEFVHKRATKTRAGKQWFQIKT